MSNEITSLLQSLRPQHKVPGQVRETAHMPGLARGASQPTVTETPATLRADRVTLSDTARQLRLSELKPEPVVAPQINSSDAGMNHARHDNRIEPAANRLLAEGSAQRPTPAMANLLEAFFTTSDMEGFNKNSDLNADGVINFKDLAALRDIETGAAAVPSESPKVLFQNMTESFLSSEGENGFDAASDLSGDGVINFQDLAILRSKMQDN